MRRNSLSNFIRTVKAVSPTITIRKEMRASNSRRGSMTEPTKQAQQSPNVLAVSFYYPPANNPRAVQVARLLEHVNLSTLLVCGDYYASDDRIDRALSPLAENLAAHCLRVPFAQATWKRVTAKIAYQFHIRLWEKAPDRYLDWRPAMLRAVRGWCEEHHYSPDLIVTFGTPM